MVDTSRVDAALRRSQDHLLRLQAPAGHWVGELEADTTITSEYLLLRHLLGPVDRDLERKAVAYLSGPAGRRRLVEPLRGRGRRPLGDHQGVLRHEDGRRRHRTIRPWLAARERILELGGPAKANVFTKIPLALFGEYDWGGVPTMPVEIMLLPRWSYFNIYEVSYWSRTVIVPLLILMDRQPVHAAAARLGLDELWPRISLHLDDPGVPARRGALSGRTSSSASTTSSRAGSGFGPRPLAARRAIRPPTTGSRSGWPCRADSAASIPP